MKKVLDVHRCYSHDCRVLILFFVCVFCSPFVLGILVKGHQVEKFPHTAPYPLAIAFLQFLGIEVRGGMGAESRFQKQLMTGQQDFADDIAILPEMSSHLFHPDVIETVIPAIAIVLNDAMADMVEPEDNVPCRYDLIGPIVRGDMPDQFHQSGLATAHRTRKQDALIGINTQFLTTVLVPDHVIAKLQQDLMVLGIEPKIASEQEFSLGIQIGQHLGEIIFDLLTVEFPQGIDHATFLYFRGVAHSPFGFRPSKGPGFLIVLLKCRWLFLFHRP